MIGKPILKILPVFAFIFTVACGPEKLSQPAEPGWLLSQDSMVAVMTDIHLVEGSRMGGRTLGDSLPTQHYFDLIWKKYGLSADLYDSNFSFYVRNPKRMDEVYEKVLERLSKMEANLKKVKEAAQDTTARYSQEELDSVLNAVKQKVN